jgi:uracil-DNA glycosylase family 4
LSAEFADRLFRADHSASDASVYDPNCRRCPRLAAFLNEVKTKHPTYFCRPVPPFGDDHAELLVLGLAPGLHGANATGRPFTGDACSDLLYGTLYRHGFGSKPRSLTASDGLVMTNCRITNAVKCLPPQNKPSAEEVRNCLAYLREELVQLKPRVILCLGAIAHDAALRALPLLQRGLRPSMFKFAHAASHQVGKVWLVDSYHPSRYNLNTGRITEEMFSQAVGLANSLLDKQSSKA